MQPSATLKDFQGSAAHGALGGTARPSLRERANGAFYRAEREALNIDRLKELLDLLDANPAVARIFELIEATGV